MQRCSIFNSSQQLMIYIDGMVWMMVYCIKHHMYMYTVVPAIAYPILSLQVAHIIWVQALHACMHTMSCTSLASQNIMVCKSQCACKLSSLDSLGEGAGNYIATMYTSPAYVSSSDSNHSRTSRMHTIT